MAREKVSLLSILFILALSFVLGAALGSSLRECVRPAHGMEPSYGESLRRMAEALEGIRQEMRRMK